MDPFEDNISESVKTSIISTGNSDITSSVGSSSFPKEGFFGYVFNFDDNTKFTLLNLFQYTILGLIPIIILNKTMQQYVPSADESKNNPEILLEIVVQLVIILVGIFFTHRLITYIPMYSGKGIGNINFANMILPFLVIILSLQTKLGEKVEILSYRFFDFIEGKTTNNNNTNNNNQNNNIVNISQPISNNMPPMQQEMPPPIRTQHNQNNHIPNNNSQPTNFDNMYQEPMGTQIENIPMAANDMGPGGFAPF